jgi:hypothetical protein
VNFYDRQDDCDSASNVLLAGIRLDLRIPAELGGAGEDSYARKRLIEPGGALCDVKPGM